MWIRMVSSFGKSYRRFPLWLLTFPCKKFPCHLTLMGRQIILKWSYLMIFMRVLVAVNVRWCKV